MKHFFYFIFILKVLTGYSQQNFINVPSSEITSPKKFFFQQQINFNELIQSNTTVDYGLGKGCEAGFNILGLNFNNKRESFFNNDTNDLDPYNPLVLLNFLKGFNITQNFSFAIGTQAGLNFDFNKKWSEAGLIYCNACYKNVWLKNSNLVIGSYYNSLHYGGEGNRLGCWLGAELPIFPKIHVLAESILGTNALSYSSFAFIYYLKKKYVFTLGAQIPSVQKNSYSLVFELTLVP